MRGKGRDGEGGEMRFYSGFRSDTYGPPHFLDL